MNVSHRAVMRIVMAAFYLVAGILHIVAQDGFVRIVPEFVPWPRELVIVTGVCEIAGALGLMTRHFRRAAGIALAAYAVCVFPANIKHALFLIPVAGNAGQLVVPRSPACSAAGDRVVGALLCGGDKLALFQETQRVKPPPLSHLPSSRHDLFTRLDALGIRTTTRDHAPVFTVEDARALRGEIPGGHCKNLFLKDARGALWLIVCLEDTRIDLKSLPQKIGSGRVSFGRPDLLREVLGVEPGSVTPFALINDPSLRINVVLEQAMMTHELLSYHPLENTATTTITSPDLVKFIRACGHAPKIVGLD